MKENEEKNEKVDKKTAEEELKEQKVKLKFKKFELPIHDNSDPKAEYDRIKESLSKIYKDTLAVDRKLVMRCMSLTCSQENEKIHLPFNLVVEKKDDKLIFSSPKFSNIVLILLFINILAFVTIAASYSAVDFLSKADLNKDINGDGIADINLDLNKDDIPEINIDTNDDNKPDINIDYKGNKKSVFNIDTDDDNKADSNLVTYKKGGKCLKTDINCDMNGTGWPSVNLDLDGDGYADTDMDANEDGVIDLNIDTSGDGVCDVNCDNNKDWKCDYNCVTETKLVTIIKEIPSANGSSAQSGNPDVSINTPTLEVVFLDNEEMVISDLYPTDQPGMTPRIPTKEFTVENKSAVTQSFNIKWVYYSNTFDIDSNNMQLSITGTNNADRSLAWTAVPRADQTLMTNIEIAPYVKQKYTVSFRLEGVNGPQNYDQGKEFSGKLQIELYTPPE